MTIHSAKGREWKHVGLALTDDGKALMAAGLNVDHEEDRILFVGLSRARSGVFLFP